MTIREYEYSGSYSFIHVQSPDGKGDLFLSNGTHYCTDASGHSCLDTYNLSKIMNAYLLMVMKQTKKTKLKTL